jgi:hypothetical protein
MGYLLVIAAAGVVGVVLTVSACYALRSTPKPEKLLEIWRRGE